MKHKDFVQNDLLNNDLLTDSSLFYCTGNEMLMFLNIMELHNVVTFTAFHKNTFMTVTVETIK